MSSSVPTPSPSSSVRSTLPSAAVMTFTLARQRGRRCAASAAVEAGRVEQVALVEHDQIGAGDLILEHFLDRIVVIERGIGRALARQRRSRAATRPSASAAPSTTTTTPSTVTRF